MQVETTSMMTKYQLVFIKLETLLLKLGNIFKIKYFIIILIKKYKFLS